MRRRGADDGRREEEHDDYDYKMSKVVARKRV